MRARVCARARACMPCLLNLLQTEHSEFGLLLTGSTHQRENGEEFMLGFKTEVAELRDVQQTMEHSITGLRARDQSDWEPICQFRLYRGCCGRSKETPSSSYSQRTADPSRRS